MNGTNCQMIVLMLEVCKIDRYLIRAGYTYMIKLLDTR